MRAISLHQPWATLVAIGAKRIETRGRSTPYRGKLAIHAAKKIVPDFGQICHSVPFSTVLEKAGYDELGCFEFGKIVAVVDLIQVATSETILDPPGDFPEHLYRAVSFNEKMFGNYSPGRFGWFLDNVIKLPEPIPEIGRQFFWDWKVSECDMCDGVGVMEGWSRRDGWPCPKCKGIAIVPDVEVKRG